MKRIIKKIEERLVVIISAETPNNLLSGPKYSVELFSAYHKLAKYIILVGPFVLCILYFLKKYVLLEYFAEFSKLISMKNQITLFCINVQIHLFLGAKDCCIQVFDYIVRRKMLSFFSEAWKCSELDHLNISWILNKTMMCT